MLQVTARHRETDYFACCIPQQSALCGSHCLHAQYARHLPAICVLATCFLLMRPAGLLRGHSKCSLPCMCFSAP